MSTFTQIYYHITFSTKNRSRVLDADRREKLFKYLWGVIKNHKSHLYRINGVEDHVHLLISLHPTVALADLVKNMKVASSVWVREGGIFPAFEAWQEGYGAFTCSHGEKDAVITYIKNQVEHHREMSFQDELRALLREAGVVFEERYLA
ncbi:MAG TPA: IS200/IS605 family transposase [Candidatus Hydrogenedentes bacterium]|nr:IS200/IS605 family transposase [Candidatus Hydrogenedentota bacterium]HRZ81012.1 IS200/IS605 family transposase [Candidatus Hydrogenedentota bacterium]